MDFDAGEIHTGEVVWVLTYEGEGFFKVWHKGAVKSLEMGFSPYGPDILLPYEMEWWVLFEFPDGTKGWANALGHFEED